MSNVDNESFVDFFVPPNFEPGGEMKLLDAILTGKWLGCMHYWAIRQNCGRYELLFQRRPADSYNMPGLLDSSAAGYYFAGEWHQKKYFREVEEELGFSPDPKTTFLLDRRPVSIINEKTGRERKIIVDVFVGVVQMELHDFVLDDAEVKGICWVPIDELIELFNGKHSSLEVNVISGSGVVASETINSNDFKHQYDSYYERVPLLINLWLNKSLRLPSVDSL